MDSFQDLLRRVGAAHDREIAQMKKKLQKVTTENVELRGKLEVLHQLFNSPVGLSAPVDPVGKEFPTEDVEQKLEADEDKASRSLASESAKTLTSNRPRAAPAQRKSENAMPDWGSVSVSDAPPSTMPQWKCAPDAKALGKQRQLSQKTGTQSPRGRSPSPVRSPRGVWTSPITGDMTNQTRKIDSPAVADMIDDFRASVKKHGASGIAGIARKFRICDDDGSGCLDAGEFVKAMHELGFSYPDEDVQELMNHFDTDGDGKIDYEEFLQACRPPMNLKRKRLVQKVFEMLDKDKNGILTTDDIKQNFRPHNDPRVRGRQLSAQHVAEEFLSTFDVIDHQGKVSLEAFTKYYQGVSASIDDDSYFELMIRNAWHMSGGKGLAENTTCLRVLVTTKDGSQAVEEVKNDLGLDKSNFQDIAKRLNQQGITDIADIKLCM